MVYLDVFRCKLFCHGLVGLMEIRVTFEKLYQIGVEGRPVVHLYIDVVGIVSVPWGQFILVPDSLQGGRQCSFTGAADKQVAAVVEEELFQIGVLLPLFIGCQQAVGSEGAFLADIQLYPSGEGGEVVDVCSA